MDEVGLFRKSLSEAADLTVYCTHENISSIDAHALRILNTESIMNPNTPIENIYPKKLTDQLEIGALGMVFTSSKPSRDVMTASYKLNRDTEYRNSIVDKLKTEVKPFLDLLASYTSLYHK